MAFEVVSVMVFGVVVVVVVVEGGVEGVVLVMREGREDGAEGLLVGRGGGGPL